MAEIMDVSRHQGTINWEKVKASGKVDGVMIRAMGNSAAGRPSAPYTDPHFARNYSECKRLGIPCGVYGYFKAVNREQADKELAYFKKLLTGRSFELPVAVDIDTHGTGVYSSAVLEQAVRAAFDLTPSGMIRTLKLDHPMFAQFCNYGHFTYPEAPWEQTDRTELLENVCRAKEAGVSDR